MLYCQYNCIDDLYSEFEKFNGDDTKVTPIYENRLTQICKQIKTQIDMRSCINLKVCCE